MRVSLCSRLMQGSSYSVGLAYELLVMEVLKKYSFHLKHTGGSGDGGQDFNGFWILPDKRVPVVGQCKCYRKPVGPAEVREFENVLSRKFQRHNAHCQSLSGYLGVMASQNWFSPSALRTFHSSKTPMIFCQILNTQDSIPHDNNIEDDITTCQQPSKSSQPEYGLITEVALNQEAQTLLGNVRVTWRLNSNSHCSTNQQRNVFLLNRT